MDERELNELAARKGYEDARLVPLSKATEPRYEAFLIQGGGLQADRRTGRSKQDVIDVCEAFLIELPDS